MKSENDLKVNDELIAKYLSGEATPEEAMALHDWLELPENKTHFEGLQAAWDLANPAKKLKTANKSEAWKKIAPTPAKGERRFMITRWTSVAIAATVLLAIVSALLYFPGKKSSDTDVLMTLDSTKNFTLPDNSQITLYHNTGIIVPKKFKTDSREVTLIKGEAFFSVAKNEQKPFIVHAAFANIRVIGTEFNVTANNDEVIVGVNEGKVLFYTLKDSVLLEKGMSASIRPTTSAQPVDISSNTWAYATHKLVFKDSPMTDVIAVVEKTYGRTIFVSNESVKNCKLTATFDNISLENVVLFISESLNLKLEKNGQGFILDGEGCR